MVLAQRPNGKSNRVADSRVELGRKALEFVVGANVNSDACALHADQHTREVTTVIPGHSAWAAVEWHGQGVLRGDVCPISVALDGPAEPPV